MAWVESHQTLLGHRKTLRLAALLKSDRFKVIGHLHALWWWALDNADMFGHLGDVTDEEIAQAAGWEIRRAGPFVAALVAAGFIEITDEGRSLHDWWDYAGELAEQRERERVRGRARRDAAKSTRTSNGRALGHPPDRPADVQRTDQRTSAGTVPNPTVPTKPPNPPRGARRRNGRQPMTDAGTDYDVGIVCDDDLDFGEAPALPEATHA